MSRVVRVGLIQARWDGEVEAMIRKHERMIDEAASKGVQILCPQELFHLPYFAAEQDAKWYEFAEPIPGPLTNRLQKKAREHRMVLIVPMYEKEMAGVYYNTSVVFDADGEMLGKYRKNHIPHLPGFWEKFYFKPGNSGYPVFATSYAKIGVYICYDRHFPEGARILGLNGAEIVFNPSATTKGLSAYLWELEQPAHAVANGYFIAAINRVGVEEWSPAKYYGSSYLCNPRGEIIAKGSEDGDELVIADADLEMIREVRNTWPFYRDRRPETYHKLEEI
ncbi:acyltransferase [Dehalococcoidia bacterium]|nr:acyltransferase [Dehalococcoidia bacterium]